MAIGGIVANQEDVIGRDFVRLCESKAFGQLLDALNWAIRDLTPVDDELLINNLDRFIWKSRDAFDPWASCIVQ